MEKILQWSIANQSNDPEERSKAPELKPEDLNKLFGNQKDDAVLMAENMSVIVSQSTQITIEDKLTAFDNFEMLIENLDNANNLKNMGLWEPLLGVLINDSHEQELVACAASVVGSSVQNNRPCQDDFLQFVKGTVYNDGKGQSGVNYFEKLIDLAFAIDDGASVSVQKKALFAVSNLLRYHYPMYVEFKRLDGWEKLNVLLKKFDGLNNNLKLRSVSLLLSLLTIDPDYSDGFAKEPPKKPLLLGGAPSTSAPGSTSASASGSADNDNSGSVSGGAISYPMKHDKAVETQEKLTKFKELRIPTLLLTESLKGPPEGEINQFLIDPVLNSLNSLVSLGYGKLFNTEELSKLKLLVGKLELDEDVDKEFVLPLKSAVKLAGLIHR
ncbi:unnamed protein product [Ambrosiozyma monospora]|uniref:Hsp70 nucleotide exchange factor FES1 n=1 Tax=Ambrosiozyma monospora TaxID=43982 RepID=A0A9W6Z0U5_AMBMO|nr:unnamed protein product [Ambrosiozyma monospora]